MPNPMVLFIFSLYLFFQKYLSWINLVQNIKIVSLSLNLVSKLMRICRIQWWCSLFLFWTRTILFGQIWSENRNYQFKLKLTSICSLTMVMFTFSVFDRKCSYSVNLVQKFKIVSFSWNLVPRLIRICRTQ